MQQDYIMRIVEQFAEMIASIFKKRKSGQVKEARELIRSASRHFLRVDLDFLFLYSPDQILDHFKDFSEQLDTERAVQCADLLHELALIEEAENNIAASTHLKILSLHLYTAALPFEKQFQIPSYFDKVSILIDELKDQALSPKIEASLQSYKEFLNTL